MKKLVVVLGVLLLVGGGYAAYVVLLRSPEKRSCSRIAELCGGSNAVDAQQCADLFDALKKSSATEVQKVTDCIATATACGEAIGCTAGGMLDASAGFARDFFKGMQRSLPSTPLDPPPSGFGFGSPAGPKSDRPGGDGRMGFQGRTHFQTR